MNKCRFECKCMNKCADCRRDDIGDARRIWGSVTAWTVLMEVIELNCTGVLSCTIFRSLNAACSCGTGGDSVLLACPGLTFGAQNAMAQLQV
jgi:hypothetical protein